MSHLLPRPFLVIATQNPVESEGTYPLPEAQIDRFIIRTTIGYPTADDEVELLSRRMKRASDELPLAPVTDIATFRSLQLLAEHVHVDPSLLEYIVALVQSTRHDRDVEVGSSPRGSLALLKLSRAIAVINGRDFVTPDDVRRIAVPGLAHRLVLSAEAWARRSNPDDIVSRCINQVPTPHWS